MTYLLNISQDIRNIINVNEFLLLFPVIFILHNVEEVISYKKFKIPFIRVFKAILTDPNVFRHAVIFLSLIVLSVMLCDYFIVNNVLSMLTLIIICSLLVNGLQHCMSSLFFRQFLPGTYTSVFLMIPFSAIYIILMSNEIFFYFGNFVVYFCISIVFMYISIFLGLFFGYFFNMTVNYIQRG